MSKPYGILTLIAAAAISLAVYFWYVNNTPPSESSITKNEIESPILTPANLSTPKSPQDIAVENLEAIVNLKNVPVEYGDEALNKLSTKTDALIVKARAQISAHQNIEAGPGVTQDQLSAYAKKYPQLKTILDRSRQRIDSGVALQ